MKNIQNYSKSVDPSTTLEENVIIYENVEILKGALIGCGSVVGRLPRQSKAVVGDKSTTKSVKIQESSVLSSNVTIYAGVSIGSDCLLGDNVSIMPKVQIGNEVLVSRNVTINSDVTIGDNTRIMDNSHITGRSTIGKNVFISVGISSVNDNVFGKNGFSDDVAGFTLGDYVSVGPGCIFLPQSKVGKGSIVAAGSVVKGEFPENVIISGNPATIVSRVPRHMKRYEDK
jgi:acetyltransferase-like isoleucine patch superfamily enzyme